MRAVTILSIVLASAVAAATPVQAYIVKGAVDCATILEEHKREDYRAMNRWWLLGYITARNYVDDADVTTGVDEHDIYDVAYRFCSKNLDSDWDYAAQHTYDFYDK